MKAHSARSDIQMAGEISGFQPYEVRLLTMRGLLPCLNSESRWAVKYYSTALVLCLSNDPEWQELATAVLNKKELTPRQCRKLRALLGKARSPRSPKQKAEGSTIIGSTSWLMAKWLQALITDVATGQIISARIREDLVARILGFHTYDLQMLRRKGDLSCLNMDGPRFAKWYSRDKVIHLVTNESWLAKATICVNLDWLDRNLRRHQGGSTN